MTATDPLDGDVASHELVAELTARATGSGVTTGPWPGLAIYRYTMPTEVRWEVRGLSIGIVAQCGQANYRIIDGALPFEHEVREATPRHPCLCLLLRIEPALVRSVSADMLAAAPVGARAVSPLDDELANAVLRFLRALSDDSDRRVLAPLHLREIVYRVLQREQSARMLNFAARQDAASPIAGALTYVSAHLAEALTVTHMAEQVNLSTSAFTRAFRELTGRSPYQYVKEVRLDRARELLIEQRLSVSDVASAIGYGSTSHFIKQFRRRFGATPGEFADARSAGWALHSVP